MARLPPSPKILSLRKAKKNFQARIRRYNKKVALGGGQKPYFDTSLRDVKTMAGLQRRIRSFETLVKTGRSRSFSVVPVGSRPHLLKTIKTITPSANKALSDYEKSKQGVASVPISRFEELVGSGEYYSVDKINASNYELRRAIQGRMSAISNPSKRDTVFRENFIQAIRTAHGGEDPSGLSDFIKNELSVDEVVYLYRNFNFSISLYYDIAEAREFVDVLEEFLDDQFSDRWRGYPLDEDGNPTRRNYMEEFYDYENTHPMDMLSEREKLLKLGQALNAYKAGGE